MNLRTTFLGVVLVGFCSLSARAAPRDFTPEARTVYAVAACGDKAPETYDRGTVATHCREVATTVGLWKRNWYDKAAPFLGKLLATPPATVLYPFGGGDVATMLAVFPNASEYTSFSLEGIGDPRPVAGFAGKPVQLAGNLANLRKVLQNNLGWAWNTTVQLSKDSSETGLGIPTILTLALVALDAHGYEPIEVKYFELGTDGALTYLTADRVETWDAEQARALKGKRKDAHALQQGIFNNVEIVFRKKGDAAAPKKTFRHIAADLSDGGLARHAGALAYIDKKRDFGAMTKAASYLFWKPSFEKLRSTFLARMALMVSDDTGIPPRYAKPAGFKQDVYGAFHGTFFAWADQAIAKELIELWKGATAKTIPFRFGYYDNRRNPHLMHTYK